MLVWTNEWWNEWLLCVLIFQSPVPFPRIQPKFTSNQTFSPFPKLANNDHQQKPPWWLQEERNSPNYQQLNWSSSYKSSRCLVNRYCTPGERTSFWVWARVWGMKFAEEMVKAQFPKNPCPCGRDKIGVLLKMSQRFLQKSDTSKMVASSLTRGPQ